MFQSGNPGIRILAYILAVRRLSLLVTNKEYKEI